MNSISPYLRAVAGFFAGMCTWLAIASLVQIDIASVVIFLLFAAGLWYLAIGRPIRDHFARIKAENDALAARAQSGHEAFLAGDTAAAFAPPPEPPARKPIRKGVVAASVVAAVLLLMGVMARAQSELRYLEQSPAGLIQELTDLIASKREQVELLEAQLAAIAPPPTPVPPVPATPVPPPLPDPAPAAAPPKPGCCDVCASQQGRLELFDDHWSCAECLRFEQVVDSARKALERWGARPLDHAVPSTSELPGVAAVRAEGREAMHALAERRSAASAAQATTRGPRSSVRPTKSSGTTTPPSVDDLRLRWNTRS